MCGVLAEMGERYDNVATYLEAATSAHPDSVVAWTLSGKELHNHGLERRRYSTTDVPLSKLNLNSHCKIRQSFP